MNRTPIKPIDLVLDIIKEKYEMHKGIVRRIEDHYEGSLNRHGYRQFKINFELKSNRVTISAHHIAWYLYYGEWPNHELDHIDRNKQNNKKENLRYSDGYLQSLNKPIAKSGLPRGVKFKNNRYEVYIRVDGAKVYMGSFKTPEEAGERYIQCIRAIRDEMLNNGIPFPPDD